MDKVQHFEIPADDLARAKKFYGSVFNWRLADVPGMEYVAAYTVAVDEKHMAKETNVINGGIMKRQAPAIQQTFAVTVADMQATLKKITQAGGTVVAEPKTIMGMGLYAYIKDTEGNSIGVWQELKK